jgi:hypothetical protein
MLNATQSPPRRPRDRDADSGPRRWFADINRRSVLAVALTGLVLAGAVLSSWRSSGFQFANPFGRGAHEPPQPAVGRMPNGLRIHIRRVSNADPNGAAPMARPATRQPRWRVCHDLPHGRSECTAWRTDPIPEKWRRR